jgi:transposase
VDLEIHKPVDLLPDKSAESFAKWLKEHPGVEIISRDRCKEYINGANEGAMLFRLLTGGISSIISGIR